MTAVAYGLCALTGLFAGPILALVCSKPEPGGITLVVSPPWIERAAVVSGAGGRLVGPSTAFFGGMATSTRPDFADRLKSEGAWFVVDGAVIAAFCGVTI